MIHIFAITTTARNAFALGGRLSADQVCNRARNERDSQRADAARYRSTLSRLVDAAASGSRAARQVATDAFLAASEGHNERLADYFSDEAARRIAEYRP